MTNYRYHPFIDDYIDGVKTGKYIVSKDVKLLIDLVERKLQQPNVIIDTNKITEAKEFIERYFPFKLYPTQLFVLACMVGLFYDDGTLVFNEFLLLWGRGAGKNGFIAAISKYFIAKQGIRGYNVDIVATSEKQAKTSFNDVRNVLEDHKTKMKKHFKWTMEEILHLKSKSTLTFHTNNAKTKDGLRPGAIIFDEVHEYESYDNIRVFTSALGKVPLARRIYITTDGYVRGGVLDDFKEEAAMILKGELPNSRMFPFLAHLDDEEEMKDISMWEKANPGINYLPHLKTEMLIEYDNLKTRPSLRIEFVTKRMNLPFLLSANGVTDWPKLEAASKPLPLDDLLGLECIGGIDYADVRDFVGCVLLFKLNGYRYIIHHTFINHRSLKLYDFKVDIDRAVKEGLATIIYEETNSPQIIADWFIEQSRKYRIKTVAADQVKFAHLQTKFEECGLDLIRSRKGSLTHTTLEPVVEEMFAHEKIKWGDDLLMRWYTWNTYVKRDGKGNITYEKIEPELRKTDGFSALLHALQHDHLLIEKQIITKENMKRAFKTMSF
ncbi:terminase large subunit [Lysinibacillus capsici]|uniref:terminase TerL endonuclease subunit n=1 Tax=Lysinibacillus capsici TaxID=2115968 RepID=UPI002E23A0AA|nr:terminase large subunit [Lysinibacillus capsici]